MDDGLEILRRGSRLIGQAALRIETGDLSPSTHDLLREAMPILRSAMDHLEGTPSFEVAHQRLDQVGDLARKHFPSGCELTRKDGGYRQECPVALAHERVGFSVEYLQRSAECSICAADPDDCVHRRGVIYDGQECVTIITEAELVAIALVERPAFADARIHSEDVTADILGSEFGDRIVPGVTPVTCDRCLRSCRGVRRPFKPS